MPAYLSAAGHCTLKVLQILLRGLARGCSSNLWQGRETIWGPINSPSREQQTLRWSHWLHLCAVPTRSSCASSTKTPNVSSLS